MLVPSFEIGQNLLTSGRDILYYGINLIPDLRNIQILTALQDLKNYQYLSKIKEVFKCFSSGRSCLYYTNPMNWTSFSKDNEERTVHEIEHTAQGILGLRIIIYLPMLLSSVNLKWGNVLLDIASLTGSFLMFNKEIILYNISQPIKNDATDHKNPNNRANRIRHLAFITSYATGVISVGLDLFHRFKWTANIIGFTGSMGAVCSVASVIFWIAGTTFQIIANRENYKKNYVDPCFLRIKSTVGKFFDVCIPT